MGRLFTTNDVLSYSAGSKDIRTYVRAESLKSSMTSESVFSFQLEMSNGRGHKSQSAISIIIITRYYLHTAGILPGTSGWDSLGHHI